MIFYYYVKDNKVKNKKELNKLAILSYYDSCKIQIKVVNAILYFDCYYIYTNKEINLEENNKVSFLTYFKENNVSKETLFYGNLETLIKIDDIILYKLNFDNKKELDSCDNSQDMNTIMKLVNYIKYMD